MLQRDKGRYVIQKHTRGEELHWDLMLEDEDVLLTWQVPVDPETMSSGKIFNIVRIHDHDKRFLQYEGAVQNNTGQVEIADIGTYQATLKAPEDLSLVISNRDGEVFLMMIMKNADWKIMCRSIDQ